MKYPELAKPYQIGSLKIKNRIAMSPMDTKVPSEHAILDDTTIAYYTARAKGGVGLIFTYAHYVDSGVETGFIAESPFSDPEACAAQIRKLADSLHSYDTKLFVQLWFGWGRIAFPMGLDSELVAPSACANRWEPDKSCRALTTDEIRRIIAATVDAARLCQRAGADGVDVCGAYGGYLGDQFCIDAFNQRTDEYGGSLENQLRMLTETLAGIKAACGKDFPVTVRFGTKSHMKGVGQGAVPGEEYTEYGRDVAESVEMGRRLVKAGCDAFLIGNGSYDALYWQYPPMYQAEGLWIDEVAPLTAAVDVPVICPGRILTPEMADRAIAEGKITAVAEGRALLADAEWANKALAGDDADICPCIGCNNGCMARVMTAQQIECAVNPRLLHEGEPAPEKTAAPKKLAVAGGGVAGMEFARTAALRGHSVTLFEQGPALGGTFVAASVPDCKRGDRRLIHWYEKQLRDAGVTVCLNTAFTPGTLAAGGFEAVAAATGSTPKKPPIPGADGSNVSEAIDVLLGRVLTGERVAVIGGGQVGCELALWLADSGKKPVIIEALPELLSAGDAAPALMNNFFIEDMLKFKNIPVFCDTKVRSISENGVTVENGGAERMIDADSVVLATGYRPDRTLTEKLAAAGVPVVTIGDAAVVGNVLTGVQSAYEAACAI